MSLPDFSPNDLREKFLRFFESRGHKVIPPSSLVPENDPTVLFTTAGMHPLVPYLQGEKHPDGKRLVNVQPCVRTGDIDEVGDLAHLTFFEMLGNWSLGDYWKKEAIHFSFDFVTRELRIPVHQLAISCFGGDEDAPRDEVSAEIWRFLGIPWQRIAFLPKKDNWWGPAGQTGPCGPDTEMFIWTGKSDCIPEEFEPEDPNWVEIWNDVFMQYNKHSDGSFGPLSQKNVDTGLGFERTLAILQGKRDLYKTELFWPIIEKLAEISGRNYEHDERRFRVIADHIKAATFILAEGVVPSNKLQGYILRRLIRRAIAKAHHLGIVENFMANLSEEVVRIYQDAYPKLVGQIELIKSEIEKEENRFRQTLDHGLREFEKNTATKKVSGKDLFNLYQTYGFPVELSFELIKERNITVEPMAKDDFDKEFHAHQELSRQGTDQKFKGGLADAQIETARLHSAAHLLHAALRCVLGEHVLQKGSNITAERLRFDFSHPDKMTDEQIKEVEGLVNKKVDENLPVEVQEMPIDEAKKSGALGVFDDRYGNRVKVYSIGDPSAGSGQVFSREICGGPHASTTRELGHFKITNETSSSAGVRRIKAILE